MRDGPGPTELEQQIVLLCGLSKLLAPGLLRRALADVRAGSPPTPADILRALPMIETRMRAYLPPNEVQERSAQMRKVLAADPLSSSPNARPASSGSTDEPSSSVRMSLPPSGRRRDGRG